MHDLESGSAAWTGLTQLHEPGFAPRIGSIHPGPKFWIRTSHEAVGGLVLEVVIIIVLRKREGLPPPLDVVDVIGVEEVIVVIVSVVVISIVIVVTYVITAK